MYTKNPIFRCYRVLFFTLYFLSLPALKATAQFYTLKPETRKSSKILLSKGDSLAQRTLTKEVFEKKLISDGKGVQSHDKQGCAGICQSDGQPTFRSY
jgi:hypothetical protein